MISIRSNTYPVLQILAVLISILSIYCYIKWKLNYWRRNGLDFLPPIFPFGSCKDLILNKVSLAEHFRKMHNELKSRGLQHGGFFICCEPFYMPVDNKIIGEILRNDNFINHGSYVNEKDDPLSGHLFNLRDGKWKKKRQSLTPSFTPSKIKLLFPIMTKCSQGLKDSFKKAANAKLAINATELIGKYFSDVVANTAFGLESNSFENPNNNFYKNCEKLFRNNFGEKIKSYLQFLIPNSVLRFFKFKVIKPEIERFFMLLIEEVITYREKNRVYRDDYLQLLVKLRNEDNEKDSSKSLQQLAAQAYTFYFGGIETSNITTILALYEIASRPQIQKNIRNEIEQVLSTHDNEICYQAVNEMIYLEMVLQEALRKYPPIPILVRQCGNDYHIPDTKLTLKKGQMVIISLLGIQNDPDYYESPDEFIPERFSKEHQIHHYSYIPFGEGPRKCIGVSFANIQIKLALVTILRHFKISVDAKTDYPLVFSTSSELIKLKTPLWLKPEAII